MTASIGVYPLTDRVYDVLFEETYYTSNRDILARQMFDPVFDIITDVKEGRCSDYVGRERFRQWEEHVSEELHIWWGFPEWNEMLENEWWMDEIEAYMDSEWEWMIFCSDDAVMYEVAHGTPPEASAQEACRYLIEAWAPKLVMVHVAGEDVIYVVHSDSVRGCMPVFTPPHETGPDDYCDANDPGPIATFVMPPELEDSIEEAEEEYEKWYEETYKLNKQKTG